MFVLCVCFCVVFVCCFVGVFALTVVVPRFGFGLFGFCCVLFVRCVLLCFVCLVWGELLLRCFCVCCCSLCVCCCVCVCFGVCYGCLFVCFVFDVYCAIYSLNIF